MNGGSDDASGHDGSEATIAKAYKTVTKAISGSFYGSDNPLIVDVG